MIHYLFLKNLRTSLIRKFYVSWYLKYNKENINFIKNKYLSTVSRIMDQIGSNEIAELKILSIFIPISYI